MLGEKRIFEFYKKNYQKFQSIFFLKKFTNDIKKRYVDEASNSKTLGVYSLNDKLLDKKSEQKTLKQLSGKLKKYDLVIVSDYGHGFITKKFQI